MRRSQSPPGLSLGIGLVFLFFYTLITEKSTYHKKTPTNHFKREILIFSGPGENFPVSEIYNQSI